MFGFITLFHHLGYRPVREHIAQILEIENDVIKAIQKMNEILLEHDRYKNIDAPNDPQADIDNKCLHHAKDHLESLNLTGQTHQKDASIDALNEQ